MTMTADAAVALYYCRPCLLRNRVTLRWSDRTPEYPCGHGCRRVEWVGRSWFCGACSVAGRTEIVYAHERPDEPCRRCGIRRWFETDESRAVQRVAPTHRPETRS